MHIILTHEQADFDALASLLCASLLYERAIPVLPRRMNRNVRAFLTLYGVNLPFVDPRDLSGGEKQRTALARALAGEPAIVLADEPTANLDSKTGHEVLALLRNLAEETGKAVAIVSHDPKAKDVADRVITMEDGRLLT